MVRPPVQVTGLVLPGQSDQSDNVDSLGVAMQLPIGSPTLEIRNVRLTMSAEDTVLGPIPLVDEFGQWIPAEWTGKAKTVDDLKNSWDEEEKALETENIKDLKVWWFLRYQSQSNRILPG